MSDLFKNTFQYALLHMLKYIPWTREIYQVLAPYKLCYAPDFLKTQDMCNKATRNNPCMLRYVPDHLQTQEMCGAVVRENPGTLGLVPDHLKTQEMFT